MKQSKLLTELIKRSGLTLDQLSKQVTEKTGIKVSSRTIKRYIKGEGLEKLDAIVLVLTQNISTENAFFALENIKRTKAELMKDYVKLPKGIRVNFQTTLQCETSSFKQCTKALKGAIDDDNYIEKNRKELRQWEIELIENCLSRVEKDEVLFFENRIEVGRYKLIFNSQA